MFRRTHRSIETETDGRSLGVLALIVSLLGAWLVWFLAVDIKVYEASARARVEQSRAVVPVEAPVSARVVGTPGLELGRPVTAGEVIVELDARAQLLSLAESRAKLAAIELEVEALDSARAVQLQAVAVEQSQGRYALDEAVQRQRLARIRAAQSLRDSARLNRLLEGGAVSVAEAQKTASEARGLLVTSIAARAESGKVKSQVARGELELRFRLADLDRAIAVRRGELLVEQARIRKLEHEVEVRSIRAGATGRISDVAPLRVGSFVSAGHRLATVLGRDDLRVIADFVPANTLGRVRTGAAARVHLDGFPWVQYGHLEGVVEQIATETRDGLVRVELAVDRRTAPAIPLQHGLTATVSVELERATAAELALRVVGVMLSPRSKTGAVK